MLDRYVYALNNPALIVDPLGLCAESTSTPMPMACRGFWAPAPKPVPTPCPGGGCPAEGGGFVCIEPSGPSLWTAIGAFLGGLAANINPKCWMAEIELIDASLGVGASAAARFGPGVVFYGTAWQVAYKEYQKECVPKWQ